MILLSYKQNITNKIVNIAIYIVKQKETEEGKNDV